MPPQSLASCLLHSAAVMDGNTKLSFCPPESAGFIAATHARQILANARSLSRSDASIAYQVMQVAP